jgi:hypothetical protein
MEYSNNYDDAERFKNAYRTHFSDSFHKVFSEVKKILILFFSFKYSSKKSHNLFCRDRYLKKQQLSSSQI